MNECIVWQEWNMSEYERRKKKEENDYDDDDEINEK